MVESDNHGFIPSSPRRDASPKSLSSYTVKQLFHLQPVNQSIVAIGWVRKTKVTNTGTIFEIEDGTGQISCSFFPSGSFEEEQAGQIEISNFLKLFGTLRTFDQEPSVSVSFLEKIVDYNFITYHFLNVIQQHMFRNRELKRTITTKKNVLINQGNCQEDVLSCFRNNQDDKGLDLHLVINMLQDRYQESEVRECVNQLLDDCFLFSVDGECYKTVD